jgi:hypothetical protein
VTAELRDNGARRGDHCPGFTHLLLKRKEQRQTNSKGAVPCCPDYSDDHSSSESLCRRPNPLIIFAGRGFAGTGCGLIQQSVDNVMLFSIQFLNYIYIASDSKAI